MKLREWFSRAFNTKAEKDDSEALYFSVQCNACQEIIRIRADKKYDLLQEFESSSDRISGYSYHKDILGQKCFNLMHIIIRYDSSGREISREISGGRFVE